jgi:hypothetical protein
VNIPHQNLSKSQEFSIIVLEKPLTTDSVVFDVDAFGLPNEYLDFLFDDFETGSNTYDELNLLKKPSTPSSFGWRTNDNHIQWIDCRSNGFETFVNAYTSPR